MNTYLENKKVLDNIRTNDKYICKGEVIFRTAIQYVIDEGKSKLNDKDLMQEWFTDIDNKHNEAEKEGKRLWVTREFEKAILECAIEIAGCPTIDLIKYLQQEWLFYEWTEISYERAMEIIKKCLEWIEYDNPDFYESVSIAIGLSDEEIETLGYERYLDIEGDDEE